MADVLERIRRAGRPALHTLPVDAARRAYEAGAEVLDLPRARLDRVEDHTIPMHAGHHCRARLYAVDHAPRPAVLYLHGGGFTIGSLDTHDSLCRQIALRSGAAVLALDYRLAPEHRFPAAVDDAWDALAFLAEEGGRRLGVDRTRLAVAGDSAGGTLAAVSALRARDEGLALQLQALITPGTTDHQDTASHARFARGYLLDAEAIGWFFDHYIARDERSDWRFAPLRADYLDGVAPAWVGLAECDPLVDEGLAYADRLRMSGVPVELDLWRGVTHDFIKMGRAVPEALQAQAALAQALAAALFEDPMP